MRRVPLRAAVIALVGGCGPSLGEPTDADGTDTTAGGDEETETMPATITSGVTAATTAGTDGTGGGPSDTGSSDGDSSGGPIHLVPPEATVSIVGCSEQTGPNLLVEVYVRNPPQDCLPAPEVDIDALVVFGLRSWDGLAGVFQVGPGAEASASIGTDALVGTFEIEVSAPFTPSLATLDLTNRDAEFVGTLDMSQCVSMSPALPCPPPR